MASHSRTALAHIFLGVLIAAMGVPQAVAKKKHPDSVILIHNVTELQNIQNNLAGNYRLARDINAKGYNFVPIGNGATAFTGMLDGNGFLISNLAIEQTIHCTSTSWVCAGLIGYAGDTSIVRNLRLLNLTVQLSCSGPEYCAVGGLAGYDSGLISSVFAEGTVTVSSSTVFEVGGLVGGGNTISSSGADVGVSVSASNAWGDVGGLAGDAIVSDSFAKGSVVLSGKRTGDDADAGGLVGCGSAARSFATGDVTATPTGGDNFETIAGGLVGEDNCGLQISNSFATGNVASSNIAGGLAGGGIQISDSYASGAVQSRGQGQFGVAGGLAGYAKYISSSYSTGQVRAKAGIEGGLIGQSYGEISLSYWDLNSSDIGDPSKGCGNVSNCPGVTGLRTNNFKGKLPDGLKTPDWMQVNFPFHSDYPKLWAPSFPITTFPLMGYSPSTMPIASVFDHALQTAPGQATGALYAASCDKVVLAYTGAKGEAKYGQDISGCALAGYRKADHKPFVLGGATYAGVPCQPGQTDGCGPSYLNYEGHPGFDYLALFKTPVLATVSGTVFYPWQAVGMTKHKYDAYCLFHTLAQIPDSAPIYRVYYLHLYTHPAKSGHDAMPKCSTDGGTASLDSQPGCYTDPAGNPINPSMLPLPEGTHVNAGCEIALSGSAGVPGPHLHFEIQQMVPAAALASVATQISYFACFDERNRYKNGIAGVDPYCLPADPYGWTGSDSNTKQTYCPAGDPKDWTGDIWQCLTSIPSRRFWAQ